MTPKFTLIAAVGASLVLAVPAAFGQSQPVQPQWMKALEARGEALNRQHGLGEQSPSTKALMLRSEALNRQHGLGEYATSSSTTMLDRRERAFGAKRDAQLTVRTGPDVFERAVQARGIERPYVGDGTGPDVFERAVQARGLERPYVGDGGDRFRIEPTSTPVEVAVVDDGREINWAPIGFGVGLGILLVAGLILALRATRGRQLAH